MSEAAKTWWVLYPFFGLTIEDGTHGIEAPMFDDFTVFSREHLPALADELKEPKWFSTADAIGSEYDTILAIRNASGAEKEIYEATEDNANLFGGIIAIATFSNVRAGTWSSSILEKLPRRSSKSRLAISLVSGRSSFASHLEYMEMPNVIFQRGYLHYTRQSLKDLLLSKDLGFGRQLLIHRERLLGELGGRLQASTLIFDSVLRQRDYSLQIVSSVTVMESLFKRSNDSYNTLEKRLICLLGEMTTYDHRLSEIIKARHAFVHRATQIHDRQLEYSALILALAAIVFYAHLAPHCKDHNDLLCKIDGGLLKKEIDDCFDSIERIEALKLFVAPDPKFD